MSMLTDEEQNALLDEENQHLRYIPVSMLKELAKQYIDEEFTTSKISPHVIHALQKMGVLNKVANQEQETIGLKMKVKEHDNIFIGLAKAWKGTNQVTAFLEKVTHK